MFELTKHLNDSTMSYALLMISQLFNLAKQGGVVGTGFSVTYTLINISSNKQETVKIFT